MPDYIDKSNALGWLDSQENAPTCMIKFCEVFAEFGEKKAEIDICNLRHVFSSDAFTWVVIDRTKERQSTVSCGVYLMRNNELVRATPIICALLGEDTRGNVKSNYMYVVDQFLNLINPSAEIRHV
jgi:hypothetical protein